MSHRYDFFFLLLVAFPVAVGCASPSQSESAPPPGLPFQPLPSPELIPQPEPISNQNVASPAIDSIDPAPLNPAEERVVHGNYHAPTDADDASGSGRFDARVVVRMIQTRRAAIRTCYERELRSDPTLHGSIRISLTIQESGAVEDVRAIENSMGNAEVASCITNMIQRFRFTPGPDGGSVTYQFPFAFEPAEE